MYSYFVQLTEGEKRYFANMIKNFLQKRQANTHAATGLRDKKNGDTVASIETSENCSREEASDIANGWLHGK
jgi:hypothetical protein